MLLDNINKENDIKNINTDDYDALAEEIRRCIVRSVAKNGGHLSSSLGVVELTMALHLCLDLPKDKILWDVGHQSLAHKILTGRKNDMDTLRCEGGISGFPAPLESPCDTIYMGHASTSLSAAIGMAKARELMGGNETIVAVIGDGALTGGMTYEAINNAASLKSNLIIILNDNEMSISSNVGGINKLLTDVRTGNKYNNLKSNVKNGLSKMPGGNNIVSGIHNAKSSLKQMFIPRMFFEEFGLTCIGPFDGHNVTELVKVIKRVKKINRPVVIHVHTQKGKGYEYAEKRPSHFHGVEPFDIITGENRNKKKIATYSHVLSSKLCEMAEKDRKITAISAAMMDGTGLKSFSKKFPERFFDVGIAEEHAVTFAAGMAVMGYKPFVAIYSTFLQRGFDQILNDVCIQKLPVKFIIERAGIAGSDGITHQGIFDLSYLNLIPGMTIMAPKNGAEFEQMLEFAKDFKRPVAIRVPRGAVYNGFNETAAPVEYKKSEIIRKGRDIAIIGIGTGVEMGDAICKKLVSMDDGICPTLVNARFVKPLDKELLDEIALKHKLVITVEENVQHGGFGESVLSYYNSSSADVKVLICALKNKFIPHGARENLLLEYGLDTDEIAARILKEVWK